MSTLTTEDTEKGVGTWVSRRPVTAWMPVHALAGLLARVNSGEESVRWCGLRLTAQEVRDLADEVVIPPWL